MAQLLIAAAGSAIGGALVPGVIAFGMTGASAGWAAGSLIGSMFTPGQKSQGPRLADLSVGRSEYGAVIPYTSGHPRVAGNIIWASDKREVATTTSHGKGGGGAESTNYTYNIDVLFLLANNPIIGILNIWSNGTLVWSCDPRVPNLPALQESAPWGEMLVGTGDAAQLPFAAYEAGVGVDNAVAYRGRGTVMITSLQLGSSGQLPNLTFELASGGSYAEYPYTELGLWSDFTDLTTSTLANSTIGPSMTASAPISAGNASAEMNTSGILLDWSLPWRLDAYVRNDLMFEDELVQMYNGTNAYHIDFGVSPDLGTNKIGTINVTSLGATIGTSYGLYGVQQPVAGQRHHLAIQQGYDGVLKFFYDGVFRTYVDGGFDPGTTVGGALNSLRLRGGQGAFDFVQVRNFDMPDVLPLVEYTGNGYAIGSFELWGRKVGYGRYTEVLTIEEPTLQDEVARLCALAGLAPSQYDVTDLVPLGRVVRSMAVSQVSSARAVLDLMASVYFFEAVLSDKIYFRPRAGASVATIAWADLGYGGGDRQAGDSLPLVRANELEIPSQIALTYTNVDDIHQPDTQYSQRLLGQQVTTSSVQVPIGFTPAEAKAAVDAMLVDGAVGATTTTFSLSTEYARLEPTDVVTVTDEDGSTLRVRISSRNEADGVLTFTGRIDDATVLTQAGVTVGGSTTYTESGVAAALAAHELLDIAMLQDADDFAAMYSVVCNWPYDRAQVPLWTSAQIHYSHDSVTYAASHIISSESVIGRALGTLATWAGGNVFDAVNTVVVDVNAGELSSTTRESLLDDPYTNLALLGSEILQFQTATLVSAGIYTLSNLLRHRRGTEWAVGTHVPTERFVLLTRTGQAIVSLQQADFGKVRYYKALGKGYSLADVEAQTITPAGVALMPYAPVDFVRSSANGASTMTWNRRSRYAGDFVDEADIALGETSELYYVDIYSDSSYATLRRTISSTTNSCTYTAAQMVADFGSYQTTLYLKVYQVSSVVGRGYPLTITSTVANTTPVINSLLAHFDALPVVDSSSYAFAATVMGTGTLSSAQSKFGGSSLLAVPSLPYAADNGIQFDTNTAAFSFGTGDFTIEFWMYATTAGYNTYILGIANAGVITSVFPQCLLSVQYSTSTNTMAVLMNTSGAYDINFSVATWPAINQWVHFALTRKAGVAYLYANGVLLATAASTGSLQYQTTFKVQAGYSRQSALPFLYLEELRIIKEALYFGGTVGVAQFTPPTAAFS